MGKPNRGDMACSRTFLLRTVKDTLKNSRARTLTHQATMPFGYQAANALNSELAALQKATRQPFSNQDKLTWSGLLTLWAGAMSAAYKFGQHQTSVPGPFPTALRLSEQADSRLISRLTQTYFLFFFNLLIDYII